MIYEIGSVTKTFTAALLMKMISEGMPNLSDSIDRYLPEVQWPDQKSVPTVLQLVTHTSGIGNDIECASEEARADLEDRLTKFSGDFEDDCIYGYLDRNDYIETLHSIDWTDVRHDFQYSNIGVIILGIVMERASGVSYGIIESEWPPAVFTPHWRILLPMRRHELYETEDEIWITEKVNNILFCKD